MKATVLITTLLTILWSTGARAEGVIFVDKYPEEVGIEVRAFASVKSSGSKTSLTDRNGRIEVIEDKRIVGTVEFVNESEYPHITDESQLDPLLWQKSESESAGAKLIEAKPYAHKAVAIIDALIAKFRSGQRKVNGKWLTAAEYRTFRADLEAEEVARREVINKRIAEQRAASKLAAADQDAMEKQKQADNNFPSESASSPLTTPAAREEAVIRFKERIGKILAKAMLDQSLAKPITGLNDVDTLSPSLSTEIGETVKAARSFRRSVGYDVALHECADETAAIETLAVIDKVLKEIKAMTPSLALAHIAAYAKTYPSAQSERLQSTYKTLVMLQALCLRLHSESQIHVGRAKVLAASGKMSEAIKEYELAVQVFPDPDTAQQLKETRRKTLGL